MTPNENPTPEEEPTPADGELTEQELDEAAGGLTRQQIIQNTLNRLREIQQDIFQNRARAADRNFNPGGGYIRG